MQYETQLSLRESLLNDRSQLAQSLNSQLIPKLLRPAMRLLANQPFPVNPNTGDIQLLCWSMVVEQALRDMHQISLLNPQIRFGVVEQVVEVLQVGLVATNILCRVDGVEMAALQRARKRPRERFTVDIGQRDQLEALPQGLNCFNRVVEGRVLADFRTVFFGGLVDFVLAELAVCDESEVFHIASETFGNDIALEHRRVLALDFDIVVVDAVQCFRARR